MIKKVGKCGYVIYECSKDNIELEALHSTTQTTTTGPIIKNQINDLNKPDNGDPTPDIEDGMYFGALH